MRNDAKCFWLEKSLCLGLLIAIGAFPSSAQQAAEELPLVIDAKLPLYPVEANEAHIQGVVKIKVTTDGKKATSLEVVSGPPMLAKYAKENILTWEFANHRPTTFVTTFEYVIEDPGPCGFSNGTSVVHLPLEVRTTAKVVETCDPATPIKPNK
jgi:hypothetical protein